MFCRSISSLRGREDIPSTSAIRQLTTLGVSIMSITFSPKNKFIQVIKGHNKDMYLNGLALMEGATQANNNYDMPICKFVPILI